MPIKFNIYNKKHITARKRRQRRRRMYGIRRIAICGMVICAICGGIVVSEKTGVFCRQYVTEKKEMEIGGQKAKAKEQKSFVKKWKQEEEKPETEPKELQQKESATEFKEAKLEKTEQEEAETKFQEAELQKKGEQRGEIEGLEDYPKELQEMLEKYPQTYDFVEGYAQRSKYQGKEIDLSEEVSDGEVPLFLQWDKRWGYDKYGSKMIGTSGCGPTCMSMAYIYLTGDIKMNPREMAKFAHKNGYDTKAGTSWNFFTEGAERLGLRGRETGLAEEKMKEVLDRGKVIICSMRPGDFTTSGHFILIRGYDAKGFLVNDPNSMENSEKYWDFETLRGQIKCLWSIGIR